MKTFLPALFAFAVAVAAPAAADNRTAIVLADFETSGAQGTMKTVDDPVMGGRSSSSWKTVRVPSLLLLSSPPHSSLLAPATN